MYRVTPENEPAEPFATPVEAEQTHLELVERSRALEVQASAAKDRSSDVADMVTALESLREAVTEFEARMSATGARMPEGNRRSLAQSILDFWGLRQADFAALALRLAPDQYAKSRPKPPTAKALAPYEEQTAIDAAEQAERCYQSLVLEAPQDAARQGFLAILQPRHPLSSEEKAALDAFVDAGVLCRSQPDVPGPDYVLVHEALPQAWERLVQWQQDAAKVASDLQRAQISAQIWQETKNPAELPRGSVVDAIEQLTKQNPSLKEYAEAAKQLRKRERATIGFVIAAFCAFVIYASYEAYRHILVEPRIASAEIKEMQDEVIATQENANAQTIAPDDTSGSDTVAGSRGWIWLGSNVIPSVTRSNGNIVDLATLEEGTEIRTRLPLKIRESRPEDGETNRAGKRIGQVSSGVTVELQSKPEYVTVRGVDQYWAKVRVIPVVYIQVPKAAQVPLDEFTGVLRSAGYRVEGLEELPQIAKSGNGLPFDVRYYYEQDRQAASDIAGIVLRALGNGQAKAQDALLPLDGSPLASRVQTGTIEIWFYQR